MDIDFSYIKKVGQEAYEMLSKDPDNDNFINSTIEYYNENFEYPENTISDLIKCFTDTEDKEKEKLLDKIKQIVLDEENVENLLGTIFFPSNGEEEEEEEAIDDDIVKIDIVEEEPQPIDEATLDPDAYFEYNINKLSNVLCISYDITYVLLNYFCWNKAQLEKSWFSNQDEVLKKLRIKKGSDMVPNLQSSLSIKIVGNGECPICYDETELYQLYCGHKLCKECLINEILQQIHDNQPPLCRHSCEDDSICGAEIMSKDIKNLVDDEYFRKYRIMIRNYIVSRNSEIQWCPCPYCNWIITPANRLPCHVGRCYRCNAVSCLLANHDSHAPLIKCELIDDFTVDVAQEMMQLEQDQKSWFAREERLKDYRRSHVSEVQSVFDKSIRDLKEKQSQEEAKEKKRISELDKELNEYQNQRSSLQRTLNQYLDSCKPKDEVNRIVSQMEDITKEYEKIAELKRLYLMDMKMNQQERNKNLNTAQQESGFFVNALSSQYQFYMNKFKESQETRAYQNISVTSNDDDYIKRITKKCPKCHSPIQRADGCNYMACNICKFEFCWACEQPWHPTHSDHFECPKLKELASGSNSKKSGCGINFNDLNDKTFYPQPMSIEKRANFISYNNLNAKFREQREKYKAMYNDLMNNENDVDISKGTNDVPDYKLCKIKRIERAMMTNFNQNDSKINSLRVVNTVLFAQSVVMWTYPALYYMARKPHEAQVFEYKASEISKSVEKMLQNIDNASDITGLEFMRLIDILKKEIEAFLDSADVF